MAISDSVSRAFYQGKPLAVGNSMVTVREVGEATMVSLYLHGSEIARRIGPTVAVNVQGFPTKTTFVRLNSLLNSRGGQVWKEGGKLYWSGPEESGPRPMPVAGWIIVIPGTVLEQLANLQNMEVLCADT